VAIPSIDDKAAMMQNPVSVDVEIEPDVRYVRLLRLMASGVASVSGLGLEDTEDCRMVVDELCAALIEVSDNAPHTLRFQGDEAGLHVSGHTRRGDDEPDAERLEVSRRIVAAACDHFDLDLDGAEARFSFFKSPST
jgi:hypothetical protein